MTVLTAIPESQALGCKIDSIIARHDAQRTSLVLPLTSLVRGTDSISLFTIRRIYNDIIWQGVLQYPGFVGSTVFEATVVRLMQKSRF